MGILNVTPDSFYDGGKFQSHGAALGQIDQLLRDGAEFIDIGGMSSRPGAEVLSETEEMDRVLPIIESASATFPNSILSVDTLRSSVAKAAIQLGAAIVNDISGGDFDNNMFETVATLQCPYILMHMQGLPNNMQENPSYENVTHEIAQSFSRKINTLRSMGVKDLILDPGFGFGKTDAHNYQLLKELKHFDTLYELPILVGLSRKSMIYNHLKTDANGSLNGTTAANMIALMNGSSILRVHDVKAASEAIQIYTKTYPND